ncbi:hypothetical protein [Listeria valentina]|uniref:hypothetical protein n=1 Tax=Listeria valentina TaxID=2705293 RepID=UPI001431CBA9|nr:hypothetical protein [Listeria valentina]
MNTVILNLLFVLAVVYTICTALIHNLIKKKNLSSMSASVIILLILLLKGN